MQRPIKFRAWHRFIKIMFKHVCKLEFSNWNGEEHHLVSVFARNHDDQAHLDEAKNWELLQFTGLKDKNGVEIFEGDILIERLNPSTREAGFVEFYEGIFWLKYKNNSTQDLRSRMFFDAEVIGNIHEHPHLLEAK